MNLFTVMATVNSKEIRYTSGDQKAIAHLRLKIKEYDDGEMTIAARAWGKMAEASTGWDAGTVLILSGSLNILQIQSGDFKEKIASLNISTARVVNCAAVPLNSIVVTGNVGQDVDARYFDSGKNNAKTSLAVRRSKDDTDWFPLEAWGKTAETMSNYVSKGSKIGAIGSLKIESWIDKDTGLERSKPVIKVDRIEFLGSKKDAEFQSPEDVEAF